MRIQRNEASVNLSAYQPTSFKCNALIRGLYCHIALTLQISRLQMPDGDSENHHEL